MQFVDVRAVYNVFAEHTYNKLKLRLRESYIKLKGCHIGWSFPLPSISLQFSGEKYDRLQWQDRTLN